VICGYYEQGKELIDLNIVAMILVIIGAINWGLIGFFQFDLVAAIFGGQAAVVSRIIYALVGLAGLWCIMLVPRVRHRKEK
jgi:uncharacterized protein